nr:hypothetical protein [Lachnospiraceae bacterium]
MNDKDIINSLSGAARQRYISLSDSDKEKFLRKAERVAKKLEQRNIEKKLDIRNRAKRYRRAGRKKSIHLSHSV